MPKMFFKNYFHQISWAKYTKMIGQMPWLYIYHHQSPFIGPIKIPQKNQTTMVVWK